MSKRETLKQRNARLREMLDHLHRENEQLRELAKQDQAWAACCHSLRVRIDDLKFEKCVNRWINLIPWYRRLWVKISGRFPQRRQGYRPWSRVLSWFGRRHPTYTVY